MKEQLIQYVNLLFAGATDCDEIRAEILQNTLDRYDDLVSQGKSPEAAYRLAIGGIGDVNEILGSTVQEPIPQQTIKEVIHEEVEDIRNKKIRAVGIALYIVCAVPLIILSEIGADILGLCLTLALIATATYLMIITGKKDDDEDDDRANDHAASPNQELKKSMSSLIWAVGLGFYFVVSFSTGAWYITWLLFPIIGCTEGLVKAIIDLKEANKHES